MIGSHGSGKDITMKPTLCGANKLLGFGCMRLPMVDGEVDVAHFSKMVDTFLENGFNYFDTAHNYIGGKSELALRASLTSRHPRSSYILTNKLTPTFFEKNETVDGVTSFVASYTSVGEDANTYVYPNIASLVTECINEKKNGKQGPDWDKVVLIPIKTEVDSNGSVTSIKSNLDMESACLVGGEKNPIKVQVLYTTF